MLQPLVFFWAEPGGPTPCFFWAEPGGPTPCFFGLNLADRWAGGGFKRQWHLCIHLVLLNFREHGGLERGIKGC